jgi:predicted enzyme related to lactoylglutathione lyase
MARVVHFEIHAADPERAIAFYRELFGWEFTRWDGPMPYWLIKTGGSGEVGIDGGLVQRQGGGPLDGQAVNAYVCTVDVRSVDESMTAMQALKGTVAVPKMAIPGIGWLAYAKDPEGNIFGMMQSDPTAR